MTYVEQLHAIVDRIAEADARRDAALSDRAAAVDELHGLLGTEQPEQESSGDAPAPVKPEASGSPPAAPPVDSDRAEGSTRHPCPEPGCDVTSRTLAGIGQHRRWKHGYVAGAAPKPATNGTPLHPVNGAHPSRKEKFLCARCSAPFLTRELRDAHQAEASCAPIPTRPPSGPAPLGSLRGGLPGFGE